MTAACMGTIGKGEEREIRVLLKPGKGRTICEIREYDHLPTANVYMATVKGVTLEVGKVGELITALKTAIAGAGIDG